MNPLEVGMSDRRCNACKQLSSPPHNFGVDVYCEHRFDSKPCPDCLALAKVVAELLRSPHSLMVPEAIETFIREREK